MKTNMNPNSIVPLYEQVAEFLKRDIENGVYNATGKIPTEAELAEQYKVSRITIRKAMDNLVGDGLVEKKQGKGTFIRRQKFAKDIKNLQSFSEMCRHMNMKPGGQMLENKLIPADDKIQKQLNLERSICGLHFTPANSRWRAGDDREKLLPSEIFVSSGKKI